MISNKDEKRQELRLCAQEALFIELGAPEGVQPTQIVIGSSVDVSANGVKLEIDRPLQPGNIHRVCLQMEDDERLYLSATVIWSRALPDDDGWAIGLQVLESEGTDIQGWKQWIAQRCAASSR